MSGTSSSPAFTNAKRAMPVKDLCHRCRRPTYFNDKIGPLKDGVFYHKGCFKCWLCGSRLTLKTYCNNRNDITDTEVYCQGHVPTPMPHEPIPHRSNLLYSPKTRGHNADYRSSTSKLPLYP
ncbi:Lim and transglutaminase domain protein [Trichinella spiralis]|uniref:Lim and transglutaminase domain protein n=1 Tax=Trichinella spiralis TaxID=6334 RepID=A0ABR3KZZ7_TRISP